MLGNENGITRSESTRMKMSRFSSFDASGMSNELLQQGVLDAINDVKIYTERKSAFYSAKTRNCNTYIRARNDAKDCQNRRDAYDLGWKKNKACSFLTSYNKQWDKYSKLCTLDKKEYSKFSALLKGAVKKRDDLTSELQRRKDTKQLASLTNANKNNNTETWEDRSIAQYGEKEAPKEVEKPSYKKYYLMGGGALVIGVVGLILFKR